MWLGISEQWWMQIWSGVIGASVAAIVSVFVALLVVNKTNAHQSDLAETARDQQRERDDRALEVQRAGMQEQLAEQRQEAGRLRMIEVRADVASAAYRMADAAAEGWVEIAQATPALERAVTRWRTESDDPDLIEELAEWPGFLRILASEHSLAINSRDPAARVASFDCLNNAVSTLAVVSIHLQRADFVPPERLSKILQRCRKDHGRAQAGTTDALPS
ncbi:hypothetical protein [Arthrobacter sp.]|uniref:hypothetical protein n=1 Tax=Arthrobacter sp. TaxID=1667 RepID=UPI003398D765